MSGFDMWDGYIAHTCVAEVQFLTKAVNYKKVDINFTIVSISKGHTFCA